MYKNMLQNRDKHPIRQKSGEFLLVQSQNYLRDLEKTLQKRIDNRYVRTFFDLFIAILTFRDRANGLLLSELGGYIAGFAKAAAGTKRISNLLRCKLWGHDLVDDFLFNKGHRRKNTLQSKGKRPLALWDDSRIEKPESWFLQGLCSVYSSKGKRLTKIKRGYYRPPSSRICVPGYKWSAVVLSALGEVPSVLQMSWWTTRGKHKELGTNIIYRMLKKLDEQMGRGVLNVMDRGYANEEMLRWLVKFNQDFLIRWKSNHLFINEKGVEKKLYLIARSYKGQDERTVWDKERKKEKRVSIAWAPVRHPDLPEEQFYLVIIRDKNSYQSPMYLLTNVPIETEEQAWEMFFSYIHRWEIEQSFRFCKSELAMESPRLWFFVNTLKLLAIVSLVYDFLLQALQNWKAWTAQLMNNWCHRTGKRYREARVPLYRLRTAIANCLLALFFENLFEQKGYFHPQDVNILLMG